MSDVVELPLKIWRKAPYGELFQAALDVHGHKRLVAFMTCDALQEKPCRNLQIVRAVVTGEQPEHVAKQYQLSTSWVWNIVQRFLYCAFPAADLRWCAKRRVEKFIVDNTSFILKALNQYERQLAKMVGEHKAAIAVQSKLAKEAERNPFMRAYSYRPIARGKCRFCKLGPVVLRFVYNPFGDDQLMCVQCGDIANQQAKEDFD